MKVVETEQEQEMKKSNFFSNPKNDSKKIISSYRPSRQ
jgi:hypothetical protein